MSADVMTWLRKNGLIFLVKEMGSEGDNPHFQGILECKINTVRTFMKRHFMGNAEYSVKKTEDVTRTLQYLCKGASAIDEPEVVFNNGMALVEQMHEAYWLENAELRTQSRKKKREQGNPLYLCYEDIKGSLHPTTSAINVGVAILKWYCEKRIRVPNQFVMGTMISTYILWLNSDAHVEIESDLFRRLYPTLGF